MFSEWARIGHHAGLAAAATAADRAAADRGWPRPRGGRVSLMDSQAPERVGPHWTSFFAQLDETIVLLTDAAGFITYASPSVTRWLGHHPADLVGTPLELLTHPQDAVEFVMALANCTATAPGSAVQRLKTADGKWRTVELTLVSLRNDALAGGVLVAGRDAS